MKAFNKEKNDIDNLDYTIFWYIYKSRKNISRIIYVEKPSFTLLKPMFLFL